MKKSGLYISGWCVEILKHKNQSAGTYIKCHGHNILCILLFSCNISKQDTFMCTIVFAAFYGQRSHRKLAEKSHEAHKRERRPLVRKADTSADTAVVEKPSTSSHSEPQFSYIEDFTRQLEQKIIHPWQN